MLFGFYCIKRSKNRQPLTNYKYDIKYKVHVDNPTHFLEGLPKMSQNYENTSDQDQTAPTGKSLGIGFLMTFVIISVGGIITSIVAMSASVNERKFLSLKARITDLQQNFADVEKAVSLQEETIATQMDTINLKDKTIGNLSKEVKNCADAQKATQEVAGKLREEVKRQKKESEIQQIRIDSYREVLEKTFDEYETKLEDQKLRSAVQEMTLHNSMWDLERQVEILQLKAALSDPAKAQDWMKIRLERLLQTQINLQERMPLADEKNNAKPKATMPLAK